MNMQTQIDLFPLGTCYYSQILISLQIPPVPMAPHPQSRTLAPWRLGPQNGHQQEEGSPGPLRGETNAWVREARGQGGQGEPGATPVQSHGQLTEPFCHVLDSSPRGTAAAAGGGNRPCYTWEGKPTCFQLSPNRPRDYDGNKSASASTPALGKEAGSSRQLPSAGQVARVCKHSL